MAQAEHTRKPTNDKIHDNIVFGLHAIPRSDAYHRYETGSENVVKKIMYAYLRATSTSAKTDPAGAMAVAGSFTTPSTTGARDISKQMVAIAVVVSVQ